MSARDRRTADRTASRGWAAGLRGKTWSTLADTSRTSSGRAGSGSPARRATALLAGIALLGAPLGGVAVAADAAPARAHTGAAPAASAPGTWIVRGQAGGLEAVAEAVRAHGGTPGRRIGIIDALVADLPAGAAAALQRDARVLAVTPDAAITLMGRTTTTTTTTSTTTSTTTTSAYDPATDPNSLYSLSQSVQARTAWSSTTGSGIDVALLDSGVVPVRGLDGAGKILHGPDLTPESQNPDTRNRDTYGHGTHMAGIIAGRDAGATVTATNKADFLGVAPGARIVSVKVADALGHTDVSQVVAGIDWVVQHRNDPGMNIRVLNLSFGTDSAQSYQLDPLAYAAEVAWRKGIVVVVSAGNSGAADGRMTLPATNPFLLAVGAADTRGTSALSDDVIPAFSSRGDGIRNPDLVSPGQSVQSLRVPGSYIDTVHGSTGAINDRFFRGSGTSQAAAFTSGAAALVLARYPTATPDQVKRALVASGRTLQAADRQAQGAGLLNIAPALTATPTTSAAPQPHVPGSGTGSLNASRGSARLVLDGVLLDTEVDIFGQPFDAAALATAASTATAWTGGTFNRTDWTGSGWAGSTWASTTWTGKTWAGGDWAGKTWATGTWDGKTWAGGSWAGSGWAGSTWASTTWTGKTWAGKTWADNGWG